MAHPMPRALSALGSTRCGLDAGLMRPGAPARSPPGPPASTSFRQPPRPATCPSWGRAGPPGAGRAAAVAPLAAFRGFEAGGGDPRFHLVEARDKTWKDVAGRVGVGEAELRAANPNVNQLNLGVPLSVPAGGAGYSDASYILQKKETWKTLAARLGVTESELRASNSGLSRLRRGVRLNIPVSSLGPDGSKRTVGAGDDMESLKAVLSRVESEVEVLRRQVSDAEARQPGKPRGQSLWSRGRPGRGAGAGAAADGAAGAPPPQEPKPKASDASGKRGSAASAGAPGGAGSPVPSARQQQGKPVMSAATAAAPTNLVLRVLKGVGKGAGYALSFYAMLVAFVMIFRVAVMLITGDPEGRLMSSRGGVAGGRGPGVAAGGGGVGGGGGAGGRPPPPPGEGVDWGWAKHATGGGGASMWGAPNEPPPPVEDDYWEGDKEVSWQDVDDQKSRAPDEIDWGWASKGRADPGGRGNLIDPEIVSTVSEVYSNPDSGGGGDDDNGPVFDAEIVED